MMTTELHWLAGPWPARLAISARPRGGDWLEEEIGAWHRSGVGMIVSLLTLEEERELELADEGSIARSLGMSFMPVPVEDRQVPASASEIVAAVERIQNALHDGTSAVIHCRQGVGRAGLLASCVLIGIGDAPSAAMARVSEGRGIAVPETDAQRAWIEDYPAAMMGLIRAG
jgi:protein tyrosine phosphatase (PTP) superfamily phosphohydrolase (DUF442 family)